MTSLKWVYSLIQCHQKSPSTWHCCPQGLYSLSGKTSYRKISQNLETAKFGFKLLQSLWDLTGTSAASLPRCLSNFRAIQSFQTPISRIREFARFDGKTSYRLVNRGPVIGCRPGPIMFYYCRTWPYLISPVQFRRCHVDWTPCAANILRSRIMLWVVRMFIMDITSVFCWEMWTALKVDNVWSCSISSNNNSNNRSNNDTRNSTSNTTSNNSYRSSASLVRALPRVVVTILVVTVMQYQTERHFFDFHTFSGSFSTL